MKIESYAEVGRSFLQKDATDAEIKNEPMFFQASIPYALEHGGPITKAFLSNVSAHHNAFLDSRVHMLMPDWYPCIPGWHHDDVERSRADGQPNYHTASYRPWFAMGITGSASCDTQFALGKHNLDEPEGVIYREWHPLVDEAVKYGVLETMSAPHNKVVHFTDRTWHQGVRTAKGGWRWFGRVTYNSPIIPANEIRRQANVYMEHPMEGW